MNSLHTVVNFTYDSKGNIVSQVDALNNKTEFTLNDAGYVISSKDAKNNVTLYERDEWNQVISITSPINGVTSFTYSPSGNILSVKDARNQTTSYTYNEQNLVASETNEAGQTRNFTYDLDGLLIHETTWSGHSVSYEYDGAKKLIRRVSPDDEQIIKRDLDGLPIFISNNDSILEQDFDRFGRLVASWQKGVTDIPVRYAYAGDGTLQAIRYGNQVEEIYSVDENDKRVATSISHFGMNQTWIQGRDILGRPSELSYPNGMKAINSYNDNSWISSIVHSGGSFDLNYSYDPNGNIAQILEHGLSGEKINNYVYDNENRLSSVSGSSPEVPCYFKKTSKDFTSHHVIPTATL